MHESKSSHPPRVVSGVQPTGNLHVGNYIGAIREFVRVQHEVESLFPIVDLHAITVWQDPERLKAQTREIAAAYLAAGIDPELSLIFHQSAVRQHTELAWLLQCVARIGWLNRMTQFKEKSGNNRERASVGLLTYPTLMAADILVYKGTLVPMGDDQRQHVEFARDVAARFNNDFSAPDFFPLPEPLVGQEGARIMSLRDGRMKMSKSDPSDLSRIVLTDDEDTIVRKIQKAKSDSKPLPMLVEELDGRPEAANLVSLYAALAQVTRQDVLTQFNNQGFSTFKPALAQLAVEQLAPITAEMRRYLAAPDFLEKILNTGAERARVIAETTMTEVRKIFGFIS